MTSTQWRSGLESIQQLGAYRTVQQNLATDRKLSRSGADRGNHRVGLRDCANTATPGPLLAAG